MTPGLGKGKPREPRPRYSWDDKKDICYQLSCVEGKSIPEIQRYFVDHYNIPWDEIPSRTFHHHLVTWNFPTKRGRVNKLDREKIVERARELWSQNVNHNDMLAALHADGFTDLKSRLLMNIRRENGLKLRDWDTPAKTNSMHRKRPRSKSADEGATTSDQEEGANATEDEDDGSHLPEQPVEDTPAPLPDTIGSNFAEAPLSPAEQFRRAQRLMEIQAASSEKFLTRKRRRRLRGVGSQPADARGLPPRHGSEISLCESKVVLELTNPMYKDAREHMQAVFEDMGVQRKIACAPGVWDAAKLRINAEWADGHLATVMADPLRGGGADTRTKDFAWDQIAMNVLKVMRFKDSKITVAKAGTTLGLNPEQSGRLRKAWYRILQKYNFTNRDMCPDDRYAQMKREWFDGSEILLNLERGGLDAHKEACIKRLIRDGTSRYRGHQTKADPSKRNYKYSDLPGPGPLKHIGPNKSGQSKEGMRKSTERVQTNVPAVNGAADDVGFGGLFDDDNGYPAVASEPAHTATNSAPVLDPQLHAANNYYANPSNHSSAATQPNSHATADPTPSFDNAADNHAPHAHQAPFTHPAPATLDTQQPQIPAPASLTFAKTPSTRPSNVRNRNQPSQALATPPIPAYFRLHPSSTALFPSHPKIWLGKLRSQTLSALHGAATAKVQAGRVGRIWGVVRDEDGVGLEGENEAGRDDETEYEIDEAEELEVYLEEVLGESGDGKGGGKGKVVFVVELAKF